ncbi:uncharacterized protein LOC134532681 [Bacillus rossius redtenbacheri]|uniref:uncharacterized protein LOC134532681 n=1 Tax=Bacillus rossius redtenbacheri TaxID=93214 RepID=UPI002FDEA674
MEHQLRVGGHSGESEQPSLNRRRRSIDNNADEHPHNLQSIMERYELPCAQYASRDDSFPSKLGDLCELLSFARSTKYNVGQESVGNGHIAATVTNDSVTQKHADLPAINHENEINSVQRLSKNKQLDEESKIVTSDEVKLEDRSGGEDEDILLQTISSRMFGHKRSRKTYSALLSLFDIPLSSSVTFNKGKIVMKDDPEIKITQNIDNTQKSIGTDVEVLGVPFGLEAFVEKEIVTASEHPKTSHNVSSQMSAQPLQPRSSTSSADRQSLQNLNKDNETLERKVRSVFSRIKGHLTNDHREKHYHANLGFIEVGLGKHVNQTNTYQEFGTADGPELGAVMGSDGSDLNPYPYPDPKPNDQPTVDTLCLTCKVTQFSKDSSQRSLNTLQPRSNTSLAESNFLQNLTKDNETLERKVRSVFSHIKGHLTNNHREKHYHANLGFIEAGLGKEVNHTKTYREFQTVHMPEVDAPLRSDDDLDLGYPSPYPYDQ